MSPSNHADSSVDRCQAFTRRVRTCVLAAVVSLLPACGTAGASFQAAPNANDAGAGLDGGGGGVDETPVGGAGGRGSQPVVDDAPLYDPNHVLEVQITLAPADWDTVGGHEPAAALHT
jgi:hypothetical protein